MKKNRAWVGPIGALLTAIVMLVAVFVVASSGTGSVSDQRNISAFILTPPPGQTMPPPVGTYHPPTFTPGTPYVPPTEGPYPPPPGTVAITPIATSSAPAVTSTSVPAPSVTSIAGAGKDGGSDLPNIAWGQEASGGVFTLWVGTYNDLPTPSITSGKAFVSWATTDTPESGLVNVLELEDLAFSPDGKFLAVLLLQHIEGEGFPPMWLYSVDLNTGVVQHMPSYSNYVLYAQFYRQGHDRILGWIDNNSVAVQRSNSPARIVLASKDGASYSEVPSPDISDSALSPDRQTLFSLTLITGRSFSLYGVDGSNLRTILGEEAKAAFYPVWSPDGNYISFASPGYMVETDGITYPDYNKSGVWLLNLSNSSQQLVSGDNVWNSTPAWSLDSANLAFLRADGPVGQNTVWFNHPEGADTNIFVAPASVFDIQQLTTFTGVKSTSLQWTPGGNILMSSTVAGTSGTRGIAAVSSTTGNAITLVSSAAGQQLEHPTLFISEGLPGMPKTGQTTPVP